MATVLGLDVGLRTMSICVLNKDEGILLWNSYDILEEDCFYCSDCGRNAKYKQRDVFFCGIHVNKKEKKTEVKKKKVCQYSLQQIASKIINKMNSIIQQNKQILENINCCILELQPKINAKMKFTSHIIYCKLCEFFLNSNCLVKFERANRKLKNYKFDKGPFLTNTYKNRKLKSIEYTRYILQEKICNSKDYLEFFENFKKKDDISDSMLLAFNSLNI